jgi:hypothetical protein
MLALEVEVPPSVNMCTEKFLVVDGGPSRGSCVRRLGNDGPHRQERKFLTKAFKVKLA